MNTDTNNMSVPGNPTDPRVMECPYGFYSKLRQDCPVYHVPDQDYFIVSRYADVKDVMLRHQEFSSDISKLFGMGATFIPSPVLNLSDPPVHSRTKPMALRAFSRERVKLLEDAIREVVDRLIDSFINDGEMEFIQQFAIPLPMTVIARQLGVPEQHLEHFKHWSDEMLVYNDPASTPEDVARADEAIKEANAYLMEKFREKRKNPDNDVISFLATAKKALVEGETEQEQQLTDDEALSMMQLILVGGNETTTNAMANGMLLLLQNPQVLENIRSGAMDLEVVIEEFLRLESPVRGFWRLTTQDTEIAGVAIPKGKLVFASFASANRDAAQFENPERLDPTRANARSHVAFGHGIHRCIGFILARTELRIAFSQLLQRLDNIQLIEERHDWEFMHVPSALVRGLKALHLRFEPVNRL